MLPANRVQDVHSLVEPPSTPPAASRDIAALDLQQHNSHEPTSAFTHSPGLATPCVSGAGSVTEMDSSMSFDSLQLTAVDEERSMVLPSTSPLRSPCQKTCVPPSSSSLGPPSTSDEQQDTNSQTHIREHCQLATGTYGQEYTSPQMRKRAPRFHSGRLQFQLRRVDHTGARYEQLRSLKFVRSFFPHSAPTVCVHP